MSLPWNQSVRPRGAELFWKAQPGSTVMSAKSSLKSAGELYCMGAGPPLGAPRLPVAALSGTVSAGLAALGCTSTLAGSSSISQVRSASPVLATARVWLVVVSGGCVADRLSGSTSMLGGSWLGSQAVTITSSTCHHQSQVALV